MTPPKDDRIEVRSPRKEQYRQHALAVHGMRLATWLKMLMHRDYTSHSPSKDAD